MGLQSIWVGRVPLGQRLWAQKTPKTTKTSKGNPPKLRTDWDWDQARYSVQGIYEFRDRL